jgi:hypothetical protein
LEKVLQRIEAKLEPVISKLGGHIFLKLNTRSPKDVAHKQGNRITEHYFRKELEALYQQLRDRQSPVSTTELFNAEMGCFLKYQSHASHSFLSDLKHVFF